MTSSIRRLLAAAAATLIPATLALPGCGGDGGGPPNLGSGGSGGSGNSGGLAGGGQAGGGGTGNVSSGLCLLNNCSSDEECATCSAGRTKCNVAEKRCIACVGDTDCKDGEVCTSFGICAPKELTCPTDATGTPLNPCSTDLDCVACDPMHQVCDTAAKKCVACIPSNTASCTGNQSCSAGGACENKCPANCTQDADCEKCEYGGVQAKACANHVCSECSTSKPCPTGMDCDKGKCVKPCGSAGGEGAECQQTAECYGCGNTSGTTNWTCKLPINSTHGTCSVPAQGCTELLASGAVLPPPFDQVTNTCSTDGNCSGVSMDVDVGQLIRDLIGSDEINLGIKTVKIQNAILKFPMKACASIEIMDDKSCGICVPCNDDEDCKPIALDPLINQLFKGDPLMQLAAAFLMDLLFGKDQEHELHQQCQIIGGGYGVCAPCANPLSACGKGSTGTVGSGTCDHDVCETGNALDPKCGVCAAAVCLADFFCCTDTGSWDDLCVQAVDVFCGTPCGGDPTCTAHTPCEPGAAMNETCSTCTAAVCEADPHCCDLTNGSWDSLCTDAVLNNTDIKANCGGVCPEPGCTSPHDECTAGEKLTQACSECTQIVCGKDPFCCNSEWDAICVKEASQEPKCPACPKT